MTRLLRAIGTLAGIAALAIAGVRCAATDALSPSRRPALALEIEGDSTLIAGSAVRAPVTVTADGDPVDGLAVRLVSSDTTVIAVGTAGDSLLARGLGRATITARLAGAIVASPTPAASRVMAVVPRAVLLDPPTLALTSVGQTSVLAAVALDARLAPIAGATVTWESADSVRVGINAQGLVLARATTVAPVAIRAIIGGVAASTLVTVTNDPASITLQPAAVDLIAIGATQQLSAVVRNGLGNVIADPALTWMSGDTLIARLDGTGSTRTATAIRTGATTVTVTAGMLSASSDVVVTNYAATIAIQPDTVFLTYPGDTATPPAVLLNARGDTLPRTGVLWSVDDPTVARVSPSGTITARDEGITMVHASSPRTSDAVTVVVTNDPAALVLDAELDTIPALGQSLEYTASVTNGAGAPIANPPVTWTTTNASVARVVPDGERARVTAVGLGSALVIATAGAVADTVRIVVRNPTRLWVDNGVFIEQRLGTMARPYARIQDGVNAADPSDTVMVRRGASAYDETVALTRRLTLLGDTTGSGGSPDTARFPVIAHDTGAAAITAYTSSPQVVQFFKIRHTTDGPAIDARGPDIRILWVTVNEDETSRIGRGILIDNTSTGAGALAERVTVNAVRGYGIRFIGVTGGRVVSATITGVDSLPGLGGEGIRIEQGSGVSVEGARVRATAGPRIVATNTVSPALTGLDLAGRHRLAVLDAVTGTPVVSGSVFNLDFQPGETQNTGSDEDGRAGLKIRGSQAVFVTGNLFIESGGLMDAVRVVDSRSGSALRGATIAGNTFTRGRDQVRTTRSTVSVENSEFRNGRTAIAGDDADTLAIADVSVIGAGSACVAQSGAAASLSLRRSALIGCPTAVDVPAGGFADLDSNFIIRNTVGVRLGAGSTLSAWHNDWFDNETAAILGAAAATVSADSNFWGDKRGPRRSTAPAAAGDSADGVTSAPAADSVPLHPGTTLDALRAVRGQSVPRTSTANATVRVVDSSGRPVPGIAVTFVCETVACGTSSFPRLQPSAGFVTTGTIVTRTVTSRNDGLAEVAVEMRGWAGPLVLVASANGARTTVTVTGQ